MLWKILLTVYDDRMRMYVTARFKEAENRQEVEALCASVKAAGADDVSFVRDVENWQKVFHDPKELWQRSLEVLKTCDALLIDVSDAPTGGRVVEAGMAYALGMPVYVIVKKSTQFKEVFAGLATKIIEYDNYSDITNGLKSHMAVTSASAT